MKQIEIQGKTFLYEVNRYSGDYDSGGYEITNFYKPTPTIKTRKKYMLWGPDVNYLEYERLFSLSYDIESPSYSKEKTTKLIMDKISILNRAEEIKRGEIIATPEDARVFVDAITNPPAPNDKLKGAAKKYREANQKNYEHLKFIYERLKNVHAENENYDYMVKLKEIIDQYKNLYNGRNVDRI